MPPASDRFGPAEFTHLSGISFVCMGGRGWGLRRRDPAKAVMGRCSDSSPRHPDQTSIEPDRSCDSSRCSAQWCKTGRACATGRYFRCNYQPRAIARQDRKQHRGRKGALPRIGDLAYDNVRSRAQGRLREKILPPFWRTRVISHLVEPSVGQGRGETSYFCRGDVLARNSRTFGLRGRYDRYAADRPGRAASTLVVPRSPAIWPVRAGGSCPSCCAAPVRR